MSCTRLSLFTKLTRVPAGTVSERGDTPLLVIVIVVPDSPPEGDEDGELGVPLPPLLPQAPTESIAAAAAARHRSGIKGRLSMVDRFDIRRIFSRY